MSGTEPTDEGPPPDGDRGARRPGDDYTWRDWQEDGFAGRPPWRRGYRPGYLLFSIVLVGLLLAIFVWAGSRV